jgi:hypothetical protein
VRPLVEKIRHKQRCRAGANPGDGECCSWSKNKEHAGKGLVRVCVGVCVCVPDVMCVCVCVCVCVINGLFGRLELSRSVYNMKLHYTSLIKEKGGVGVCVCVCMCV